MEFQSTRPIRGATFPLLTYCTGSPNFNPRAPYGARLVAFNLFARIKLISIHAPHTGRDSKNA